MNKQLNLWLHSDCKTIKKTQECLSEKVITESIQSLRNWHYIKPDHLRKTVSFTDFEQTMHFVNAVAKIATQQDHHPQMIVSYKQCVINYTTHSVNGVSENDFICAAKINQLIDDL